MCSLSLLISKKRYSRSREGTDRDNSDDQRYRTDSIKETNSLRQKLRCKVTEPIKINPRGHVQLLASSNTRDGEHKMKLSSMSKTRESAFMFVVTLWKHML